MNVKIDLNPTYPQLINLVFRACFFSILVVSAIIAGVITLSLIYASVLLYTVIVTPIAHFFS
jgi:hypothetical protein